MTVQRERERTTFLELSQVVERTNRYAKRARDLLIVDLQRNEPMDGRTRMFLEALERQRGELEAAMARASDDMPANLLEARIQYTVDPWDTQPEPPRGPSIDEALRWMLGLDAQLIRTYRELAERKDNDEAVRSFFESLADLVRGFDRQIVRAAQDAHDL